MFGCITDPVMGKLSPKTVFENLRNYVVSLTDMQKAETGLFREFGPVLLRSSSERLSLTPWDRPWPPHDRRYARRSCIRRWTKRPGRRPSTWNRVPRRCRGAESDRRRRRGRGIWRPSSGRLGSCRQPERAEPHRPDRRDESERRADPDRVLRTPPWRSLRIQVIQTVSAPAFMSSFHFFTVSTSLGILSFSAKASIVSALTMTPFLISSELSSLHL